jgi:hypothetical protein
MKQTKSNQRQRYERTNEKSLSGCVCVEKLTCTESNYFAGSHYNFHSYSCRLSFSVPLLLVIITNPPPPRIKRCLHGPDPQIQHFEPWTDEYKGCTPVASDETSSPINKFTKGQEVVRAHHFPGRSTSSTSHRMVLKPITFPLQIP